MERLSLETQTLYAELMERLLALEAHRTIGRAPGCFTTKKIKGDIYYYFQNSEPGGIQRQVYIGKKSPALEKALERYEDERETFIADFRDIRRLCAQLRAGAAMATDPVTVRVLKALADSGVFQLGGVLVGTHAFSVLGNLLGIRWRSGALKTQDIDIARPVVMRVALPDLQIDMPGILEGLEMGFLPVPALDPKHPSTSFKVRGRALRVDFLTSQVKPRQTRPVFIPRFNVAAKPLRFLDYLIEDPERAAVIDGDGVLVNVPSPARFALHKLIVARERPVAMHGKMEKDMTQAAQILSVLAEERPGDLMLAWDAIERRGDGWVKRFKAGLAALKKDYRETFERVSEVVPGGLGSDA